MKKILFIVLSSLAPFDGVILAQVGGEVHDTTLIATTQANHADSLQKWVEQINKATEQINKLNDIVSNLTDVQSLLGKGMELIGIDPSITSTIDLAKSLNNFGNSLQDLQHTATSTTFNLDTLRQATTDPTTWQRYVTTSKAYDASQKAQQNYDDQMKSLAQQRKKAEAQLKAAKSLGETAKAQAALDAVNAAERALAEERKRSFEQQQANYFENQNQKDAWNQAARDWSIEESKKIGEGIGNFMSSHPAFK
ncbi:MAG: hypothetical protein PHV34_19145 [Verrucomicrobiae bacterium]|nr:hypothetical protein [Verrucomicrobiae bacterium]